MKCTHYVCRCARAHELAVMGERRNDPRLLAEAIAVHSRPVTCRLELEPANDETFPADEGPWGTRH